jgi:DNA-binding transcriptional regulator YiaG
MSKEPIFSPVSFVVDNDVHVDYLVRHHEYGEPMSPLREARIKAGKSAQEIATALGVSQRTVRRWELGETRPPFDSVVRVARILRRRAEDLVKVA